MPRPQAPLLELVWPNKDKFLLSPKDDAGKPVWVERTHPAASEVRLVDYTGSYGKVGPEGRRAEDNLVFTGDSLDVLRLLAEHPELKREYRGKVRCVYIDPPFNTGQAFEHYDDWMEHSTWLSFMRDRLLVIKELLAPNGSVWVHLDDGEVHRMRCLMDEVFGAGNAVPMIVWERTDGAKGDAYLSGAHDYVIAYAKDLASWKATTHRLPRTDTQLRFYANPDDDPRGPWKQNADSTIGAGKNNVFPIEAPNGELIWPPTGKGWRFPRERFEQAKADGRVYYKKATGRPGIKTYLNEIGGTSMRTWWPGSEVGTNRSAKRDHLNKLWPDEAAMFDTPKPEPLLERIVHFATDEGDIVLDCFVGSGTTAAVAHKMRRRWVAGDLSQANLDRFAVPRLRRVVDGGDPYGITEHQNWTGGGGFRTVTVAPSMYDVADNGTVLLSERATNGDFARAMAAQLDFDHEPDGAPFCGRRGRMRLAVFDGAVGPEEIRVLVPDLAEGDRVTVVAKVVLAGAEQELTALSKGSRVRKAPRDVLADGVRRGRRRETMSP